MTLALLLLLVLRRWAGVTVPVGAAPCWDTHYKAPVPSCMAACGTAALTAPERAAPSQLSDLSGCTHLAGDGSGAVAC
ncbi:hypothetical protein XENTR_v10016175 [Xenopus tropicalis]|nr:hypothetical protein XENTR_v10016175 [Xenopus tropicalis]